jgi:hypothetical protein
MSAQPAFRDLLNSGDIRGRVLDAGGLDATGVDIAPVPAGRWP